MYVIIFSSIECKGSLLNIKCEFTLLYKYTHWGILNGHVNRVTYTITLICHVSYAETLLNIDVFTCELGPLKAKRLTPWYHHGITREVLIPAITVISKDNNHCSAQNLFWKGEG